MTTSTTRTSPKTNNSSFLKHPDQRVGVFLDIQNLYYSARALFGKKVNFRAILEEVVGERKLIRAIAYVVRTDNPDEQAFFEALEGMGIEIREKDLQVFTNTGNKKGDWDVGLTVDAIRLANSLDVIVLLSGDGDYIPLVSYLQDGFGKRVEVAGFGNAVSMKLQEAADEFLDLSANQSVFTMHDKRRTMRPKFRR